MILDQRLHYTFAPLILRLALAAIFIYHGNQKVNGTDTELGAAWAASMKQRQSQIPPDVFGRLNRVPEVDKSVDNETVLKVESALALIYAREAPPLPATLQTHAAQYAVAWGELLGGVALLVGVLTRVAALGLIIIQIGAIALVTGARGFSFAAGGGYEFNLALLAMCLALVVMGGGTWAVDRFFRRTTTKQEVAQPGRVPVTA